MLNGFSLIELMLTLTITMVILSLVISSVTGATQYTKKVADTQHIMQSLFFTMDAVRSDLKNCGKRLQEAGRIFDIPVFEYSENSLKIVYGIQAEVLAEDVEKGEKKLVIHKNDYFKKGKGILIYSIKDKVYEWNEIKEAEGQNLELTRKLSHSYRRGSDIIALRSVEYKYYEKQRVLKRKLDRGYFQPLTENCSDFHVTFYSDCNSVLYRVEVNNKEQLRGYVYMPDMVKK